jgi:hypothetical protein
MELLRLDPLHQIQTDAVFFIDGNQLGHESLSSSSEKLEKGRRDQPPGRPAARSQTFMQAIMLPLLMPAKIT